jgi:hypothetical protein
LTRVSGFNKPQVLPGVRSQRVERDRPFKPLACVGLAAVEGTQHGHVVDRRRQYRPVGRMNQFFE